LKLGRQERQSPVRKPLPRSELKLPLLDSLKKAGYLQGLLLAGGRLNGKVMDLTECRMASNKAHYHYLVETERYKDAAHEWEPQGKPLWPAWMMEIFVTLKYGDSFSRGLDIDDKRTNWVLPASYVPEEAIGNSGLALFIRPASLEFPKGFEAACSFRFEEKRAVVVHPESVLSVPLPKKESVESLGPNELEASHFSVRGKVDGETGLVVAMGPDDKDGSVKKASFYQMTEQAVRPGARCDFVHGVKGFGGWFRPDVSAIESPVHGFAVMVEGSR